MKRILVQHLSGSRTNQEDTFQAGARVELLIGREADCHVRYDQDRDDIVSRRHARMLVTEEGGVLHVTLSDLHSANGLFVNGARVVADTALEHGDVVRLGLEGPEFLFKIDPPPGSLVKATRVFAGHGAAAPMDKATRVVSREDIDAIAAESRAARSAPHAGVQSPQMAAPAAAAPAAAPALRGAMAAGPRTTVLASALAAVIVLGGAAAYMFNRPSTAPVGGTPIGQANANTMPALPALPGAASTPGVQNAAYKPLSSTEIVDKFSKAVVVIHANWSLKDSITQRTLYHRYRLIKGSGGQGKAVPCYIRKADGRVVPWVVSDPRSPEGLDQPAIGGTGRGTGFVATENGYVITNRHVAAGWMERFIGSEGLLFREEDKGEAVLVGTFGGRTDWIPGRDSMGGKMDVATVSSRYEVQFENNENSVSAEHVSTSSRHDVAILRVNGPASMARVELKDTYDSARRGDNVVVLGYPAISGSDKVDAKDNSVLLNRRVLSEKFTVTATPGSISNIHRAEKNTSDDTKTYSQGDTYQLTVNATGAGNSGGPVLNDRGEVIAIFFAGRSLNDTQVSLAVPIRYAIEMMNGGTPR